MHQEDSVGVDSHGAEDSTEDEASGRYSTVKTCRGRPPPVHFSLIIRICATGKCNEDDFVFSQRLAYLTLLYKMRGMLRKENATEKTEMDHPTKGINHQM